MRLILSLFIASTLALRAAEPAPLPIPPQLPVADLFGLSAISQMQFSPDGRYLAALQPWERRMNLIVVDLQTMKKTQITSMKENDVSGYFWAGENRIFFFMDEDGKEQVRLHSVDADGRNLSSPGEARSSQTAGKRGGELRGLSPVGRIQGDNDHYVMQARANKPSRPDIYHYNLHTGRSRLHALNPGNFSSWIVDRAGVARFGIEFELGVTTLHYRDNAKAEWEKLATFQDGEPTWTPLAFDGDNQTLFVAANFGRKTTAVYRYDTKTRTMGELVHGDDTYDVGAAGGIIFNEALNRVIGLTYDADYPRTVWIDKSFAQIQRGLDAVFPDTLVSIARAAGDNSKLLIRSFSDRNPGSYYILDQKRQALEKLADLKPNLVPAQLAAMHPIKYVARDGLVIHGYLTLPVGRAAKNLPLVVHPHGGPFGPRDIWGFNPEVQFYANRGFAVLQMNFRGSGGYGDFFERAGYKKWGLEMQDDITDAVKWAVAQGIADPKRVMISGASYGGYATMAGLVYTPELYCAGINYVGVTDINMLIDSPNLGMTDARNGEWWRRTRIGDPFKDKERIKATSPVNFADRVRVPLLMAYGENDPRVEIAHGSNLVRALKSAGRVEGRDFWFITEKHEGHGFRKEEKRIAFYTQVDDFLKKYVGVGGRNAEVSVGPVEVLQQPAKSN